MARMFKHIKSYGLVTVSIALVLALLMGSVVPAKAAAPERIVKIGLFAALTGAIASSGVPLSEGSIDAARYINDQGGINGIKIQVIWDDIGPAMVPRAIAAHKRFREAGVVVENTFLSVTAETLKPTLKKDGIPLLYTGSMTPLMVTRPLSWIFTGVFGAGPEITCVAQWFKDTWSEERPPRLGYIFFDEALGWAGIEGCERSHDIGIEFVGYEVVPFAGVIDTSVEWLRLSAKKPDLIYVTSAGATSSVLIKDAARLGLQEKGIKLCGYPSHIDESILAVVGADGEGWYLYTPTATRVELELPGVKLAMEKAKEYRGYGPEKTRIMYLAGVMSGLVMIEGIRLAIEKVGLDNLTSRAVRDSLASIKDFDTGGLVPPVTMDNDHPYVTRAIRIRQVQQGELVPVSDWYEPIYWYPMEEQ